MIRAASEYSTWGQLSAEDHQLDGDTFLRHFLQCYRIIRSQLLTESVEDAFLTGVTVKYIQRFYYDGDGEQ
jgi:hypothetical protein